MMQARRKGAQDVKNNQIYFRMDEYDCQAKNGQKKMYSGI
jgi:hypothetical protein